MKNDNSTKTRIKQNCGYKLPSILTDKYGFKLINNYDGLCEYRIYLSPDNYIEIINFENIFSLIYYFNNNKYIVANRYECNTDSELEFILLNGRWGDEFKVINNSKDV
jgi:hypothetical protein